MDQEQDRIPERMWLICTNARDHPDWAESRPVRASMHVNDGPARVRVKNRLE
jgi:hypothetical protein